MDALLEQECTTEKQLETYKTQLSLVERQLEAGASDSDTGDLQQLKENLSELISLTEDALLELKKQRLLFSVQTVEAETSQKAELTDGESVREKEDTEREGKSSDDMDDLQGVKCQAPMEESWGAVNYHNAIILYREDTDLDERETEDIKVCVFFTQPTSKAMKPCPFFLEGRCRFESTACKFSHGHIVSFSDLLTYQEPDYNLACVGGKCLAKYSDDIWYPAIISSFDGEFTVHFPSLNETVQAPIENVFPLEGSEPEESSSSSSEEEDDQQQQQQQQQQEQVVMVEWTPSGPQRPLGDWEKHTTGIGSKLMAKMGYVIGKGLGKNGEGRVEPVEIKILPAGKSLDMCAEMREKGKLRRAPGTEGEGKRRRKRKNRRLIEAAGIEDEKRVDIFEFLNAKLQKKESKAETQTVPKPKTGNLNVQLFSVQEEMKSVHRRRHSLQAQLARHKGRDKMMETHVSEKLSAVEKEIERLQAEERKIERNLAMKSERKKLRIF